MMSMQMWFKGSFVTVMALVILGVAPSSSYAKDGEVFELPINELWEVLQGGRMYDNWFAELVKKGPDSTHPALPKKARDRGMRTWRCTTCHGWDYKGSKGAFNKSIKRIGIKGIRRMSGKSLAQIKKVIRNRTHGYTAEMIPDSDLNMLAKFINKGQDDYAKYYDNEGKPKGDITKGNLSYTRICAKCHGADGKNFNMGSARRPIYVGTSGVGDPNLVIHKVIYGQPGSGMVSYGEFIERLGLEDLANYQDVMDLVAYTQTLPVK